MTRRYLDSGSHSTSHDEFESATKLVIKVIDGKAYAVAYDLHAAEIVWSLVNYSIFLSQVLLNEPSTVESALWAVTAYRNFLARRSVIDRQARIYEFHESTDDLIVKFREEEFRRVFARASSNHDAHTAKRTVNAKLIHIYHFLNWYQASSGCDGFFGGADGTVTTSLKPEDVRMRGSKLSNGSMFPRYPLLNRRVGQSSRQSRGYTATNEDRERIRRYFLENFTNYVAIRNILMMDIADRIGWRLGAINSLSCEQFSAAALERMSSRGLPCVPAKQKNGYLDSFYVPPDLAFRIAAFINDTRQKLVEEMGWYRISKTGSLFVSARDGKPLTGKAISKMFGRAFALIGAPKRSALHSLRTKFANDAIGAETLARVELGLDTSSESVSAAVSQDLGHRSLASIQSYVSANQTRLASRKRNP
ncbi:hypothetical protein [Burkholderia vietnamiensis]|uniref:hypothetical protein n=1 Tax=Burkholderia vietnamiensis TaxID=60552 RepID=UPI001CF40D37|nr:hypothetical protein [Burkholderia vietnamiensis]MCA8183853.1 hypothetical protein [Burkholderia vietnamiensis]